MTQKTKRYSYKKGIHKTTIKFLDQQPLKFAGAICPINAEEQKEKFLKYGKAPQFVLNGNEDEIDSLFAKAKNQIRFDLFGEAEYILNTVKEKYGDGENYFVQQYGEAISKDDATEELMQYLKENNLDGAMSIVWCADLQSTARMMWVGPHAKVNKPEARTFSFWIRHCKENQYISLPGIRCLADHEIGTHFFRSFNDGLQPWYSDRRRFGLRGMNTLEHLRAEEGLAAINTIVNAKEKLLWGPAMLYYTSCKAAEMSFKQLYDHLATYVSSPERRWRYCTRVKRGLVDPNDIGGFGKDQCYFEGAVEILRNLESIDFSVLISGKICLDEIQRCKRLARKDTIKVPSFMRNEKLYKKKLQNIAAINGILMEHPKKSPPAAYMQRLKRGRRVGPMDGKVRRRKKGTTSKSQDVETLSSSSSFSSSLVSIRSDVETDDNNVVSQSKGPSHNHHVCNIASTQNHISSPNTKTETVLNKEKVPFKFFCVSKQEQGSKQVISLTHPSDKKEMEGGQVREQNISMDKPCMMTAFCESQTQNDVNKVAEKNEGKQVSEANCTSHALVNAVKTNTKSEIISLSQLSTQSAEMWKDVASKAIVKSSTSDSLLLEQKGKNDGFESPILEQYVSSPYPDVVSLDGSLTPVYRPNPEPSQDIMVRDPGTPIGSVHEAEPSKISPTHCESTTESFDALLLSYSCEKLNDPGNLRLKSQDILLENGLKSPRQDKIGTENGINYLRDPLPPISARKDDLVSDGCQCSVPNDLDIQQIANSFQRREVNPPLMTKLEAAFTSNQSVPFSFSKIACSSNLKPLKKLPSLLSFHPFSRVVSRNTVTRMFDNFDYDMVTADGSETENKDNF